MAGFPDRDSYYAQCSFGPHLGNIQVPTIILSCLDDPFAPAGDILKQAISPAVHLHVERFGGRMGYVSDNLPDRRWLDFALEHYLMNSSHLVRARHSWSNPPDSGRVAKKSSGEGLLGHPCFQFERATPSS
jgi:predicted alpha/beta-fold hydrolase